MKQLCSLAAVVAFGVTAAAAVGDWEHEWRSDVPPAASVAGDDLAFFTGRWFTFFGQRLCAGQQVYIPGGVQCV